MSNLKNILQSRDIVIPKEYEVFKNVYKHFRGKQVKEEGGVNTPGDPRPLLERTEDFYLNSSPTEFIQADILDNVPSCWIAKDSPNGELVSYISDKMMAMILSSECDTELRTENSQSFVRLCPVYLETQLLEEQGLKKGTEKFTNFKGNLKANNYTEYFWMPPLKKDGAALIADLSNIFSIGLEDLHDLVKSKTVAQVASLSQDAYFIFLLKTAWFFLRPSPTDTLRANLSPLIP